jgi:hypothetical protein
MRNKQVHESIERKVKTQTSAETLHIQQIKPTQLFASGKREIAMHVEKIKIKDLIDRLQNTIWKQNLKNKLQRERKKDRNQIKERGVRQREREIVKEREKERESERERE